MFLILFFSHYLIIHTNRLSAPPSVPIIANNRHYTVIIFVFIHNFKNITKDKTNLLIFNSHSIFLYLGTFDRFRTTSKHAKLLYRKIFIRITNFIMDVQRISIGYYVCTIKIYIISATISSFKLSFNLNKNVMHNVVR